MLIIDKTIYIFESMLFVLSRAATSKGEIQQILNLYTFGFSAPTLYHWTNKTNRKLKQ